MTRISIPPGIPAPLIGSASVRAIGTGECPPSLTEFITGRWPIASLGCGGLVVLADATMQTLPLDIADPIRTAGAMLLVGLIVATMVHASVDRGRIIGRALLPGGIPASDCFSGSAAA